MKIRARFLVALFAVIFLSGYLPVLEKNHVFQQTVFAQSYSSIPITFPGGSPGCTLLVAAVTGQRVYVQNGILSIPYAGTGLSVQFVASTATGTAPTTCPTNVTNTNVTGVYVGANSTTVYTFSGSPAFLTPASQGLSVTVSGNTGADPVGGHLTFIQQ